MKKLLLTLMLVLLHSTNVLANDVWLNKIEAYLNSLNTFEADFEQYSTGVDTSTGKFYWQKPRKLLWQYKTPHQQKLVAPDGRLFFYDPDTNQVTQIPFDAGPASIFAAKVIKLNSDETTVKSINERTNFVEAELEFKNQSGMTPKSMTLVFETKPNLTLRQMVTIDGLDNITYVTFFNVQENVKISADTFKFVPPGEEIF